MTDEQKLYFIYGFVYGQAVQMKEDGNFPDLEIKDIIKILIEGVLNEN